MSKAISKITVTFEDGTQEEISKGFAVAYNRDDNCYSVKQFYHGVSKDSLGNMLSLRVQREVGDLEEEPANEWWE